MQQLVDQFGWHMAGYAEEKQGCTWELGWTGWETCQNAQLVVDLMGQGGSGNGCMETRHDQFWDSGGSGSRNAV